MNITHYVIEWNGSTWDLKFQERSGATILNSFTVGHGSILGLSVILKGLNDSLGVGILLIRIAGTDYSA